MRADVRHQLLTLAPRTSCDPAGAKALLAVDGDDSPFAWAALSGHPPKPEGSRLLARGVEGDSARQATILMAMEAPFAQAAAPLPFNLQILRRGLDMAPVGARQPMEVMAVGVSVSLGDRHSPIPKGGYAHLFIGQDGETPTMCHHTLLHGNFHVFLLRIDEDLAAKTQADGCRRCGDALHKNRYQRKPRGGGLINLGKGPHFCLSLTCKMCGKRHNPPSVRFLGSRVYVAATVVLASALRFGLTDARMARLSEWLRVPERTIARWRHWWLKDFVESLFWKNARARFMPPVVHAALPASLLEQFKDPDFPSQLVALLHFLTGLNEGAKAR